MRIVLGIIILLGFVVFLGTCKRKINSEANSAVLIFNSYKNHFLQDVIKTIDGNYMLCGKAEEVNNGPANGFVMKVDGNFHVLWYKVFEAAFYSLAEDENGNTMVAGTTTKIDTGIYLSGVFYTVYLDANGNKLWEKTVQANPTQRNYDNVARKVLYMQDKTFVVLGRTVNLIANVFQDDIFCFKINSNGGVKWTRSLMSEKSADSLKSKQVLNAVIADDGNIIVVSRNFGNSYFPSSNPACSVNLLKTRSTGDTFTTNDLIWKGKNKFLISNDISGNCYSYNDELLLAIISLGGDDFVVADQFNKGLQKITNNGSQFTFIPLKNSMSVSDENKMGNQIIITGNNPPGFATMDLTGKLMQYSETLPIGFLSTFKKTFMNDAGEYLVFGTQLTGQISLSDQSSKIMMLKFDKDLKLKK
jgi:hypothetical protein